MLRPGEAWHYSNLAFGAARRGRRAARRGGVTRPRFGERVLEPLGLDADGVRPSRPARDRLLRRSVLRRASRVEAELPVEGPTAAMGWLWSTVDDLARWGDFLATGGDGVLARDDARRDGARAGRWSTRSAGRSVGGSGSSCTAAATGSSPATAARCPGSSPASASTAPSAPGAVVLRTRAARAPTPEALALDLAEAALDALPRGAGAPGARTTARPTTSRRCSDAGGRRARELVLSLARRAPPAGARRRPAGPHIRGSSPTATIAGASSRAASSARCSGSPATTRARRRSSTSRRTRSRGRRPRSRTTPRADPRGRRPRRTRPRRRRVRHEQHDPAPPSTRGRPRASTAVTTSAERERRDLDLAEAERRAGRSARRAAPRPG